jgi:hypothetical protein
MLTMPDWMVRRGQSSQTVSGSSRSALMPSPALLIISRRYPLRHSIRLMVGEAIEGYQ